MGRFPLLLLCGCALLAQMASPVVRKPIFISPSLANAVVYLSPPPVGDETAELYALHKSATPAQIAAANSDNEHEDIFAIGSVLGAKFTKETMPATATFWADVNNDLSIVVTAAKQRFGRMRPYDLDPVNLKSLCGSKPGGPKGSYPSGHGAVGYASAMLLGRMVPEKASQLRARADEYAHNRVVCGDHYSSDLRASKDLTELVLGNLTGQPHFEAEFDAAQTEVRKALGLAAETSMLYPVEQDGRWGFIDGRGQMAIASVYAAAAHFAEGLAPVKVGDKFGYIDVRGNVKIEPRFDEARFFYHGMAPVREGSTWGFIGTNGAYKIAPRFEVVRSFQDDMARVRLNGLWGFIDLMGNLVIGTKFQGANGFNEELAPVQLNGKWGFIDKQGNFAIEATYQVAHSFAEGIADVEVDGKWGFVDHKGSFAIPARFAETAAFSEGLAPAREGSLWGFIRKDGRFAIAPRFTEAKSFENGLAQVELGTAMAYIDPRGKVVWQANP